MTDIAKDSPLRETLVVNSQWPTRFRFHRPIR